MRNRYYKACRQRRHHPVHVRPLREFSTIWNIVSCSLTMSGLDIIDLGILVLMLVIYLVTVFGDLRDYARRDPLPQRKD